MAYNKFTLQDLKEKLNLEITNFSWLPDSLPEILPDALLLHLLNEAKLQLNGYCDFILSLVPNSPLIEAPVFCVIEAKKTM